MTCEKFQVGEIVELMGRKKKVCQITHAEDGFHQIEVYDLPDKADPTATKFHSYLSDREIDIFLPISELKKLS